jgi:hypothetical protein
LHPSAASRPRSIREPAKGNSRYIIIDAVIDLEWTRKMRTDAPDNFFIQPRDIAAEVWHVAHQPRSAWSFNVELRPFCEHW